MGTKLGAERADFEEDGVLAWGVLAPSLRCLSLSLSRRIDCLVGFGVSSASTMEGFEGGDVMVAEQRGLNPSKTLGGGDKSLGRSKCCLVDDEKRV